MSTSIKHYWMTWQLVKGRTRMSSSRAEIVQREWLQSAIEGLGLSSTRLQPVVRARPFSTSRRVFSESRSDLKMPFRQSATPSQLLETK